MINRENLVKIGRAGGKTSNRETPDQIGRVGISERLYALTDQVEYLFTESLSSVIGKRRLQYQQIRT